MEAYVITVGYEGCEETFGVAASRAEAAVLAVLAAADRANFLFNQGELSFLDPGREIRGVFSVKVERVRERKRALQEYELVSKLASLLGEEH